MKDMTVLSRCALTLVIYIFICDTSDAFTTFKCKKPKDADPKDVPLLPESFTANMRINFLYKKSMVEMTYARNLKERKELIEFKSKNRHTTYISTDKDTLLYVEYHEDAHPTCEVIPREKGILLKKEDSGEKDIVLNALEIMLFPNLFDIYSASPEVETGVFENRFEGCLSSPRINISLSYAEDGWEMPYASSLIQKVRYPVTVTADIDGTSMTILYNRFDPNTPDDTVFQPPFDVYCDGYRADRKIPQIPDYFSYQSEKIVYESAMGIAPVVSHTQVFYDYEEGMARVDYDAPLSDNHDLFGEFRVEEKSIIYDFKSGTVFINNPLDSKCNVEALKSAFDFLSFEPTDSKKQMTTNEYFWISGGKTSYNGQFPVRGMMADVYTGLRKNSKTGKSYVISWYFSTNETRVLGTFEIEKNALLRIYVRPETDLEKEGVTEINFYSFFREEPNIFTYDVTNCFNESLSKIFVITFPAVEALRGLERFIGLLTFLEIHEITGVRTHRIKMLEVTFSSDYIYAQFSLVEAPPVEGKHSSNETSLDEAVKKLEEAVSKKEFIVHIPAGTDVIPLAPVPNGLNVFAGDHVRTTQEGDYKKGEVIGLTIGMLLLGFLLGLVALNLIMSRKFGVSLFKKSQLGNNPYGNFNGESSM